MTGHGGFQARNANATFETGMKDMKQAANTMAEIFGIIEGVGASRMFGMPKTFGFPMALAGGGI
jgi:hypothetical protein